MAFTHSKNTAVSWGGFSISAYCDKADLARTIDLAETTTYTTSSTLGKSFVVGAIDASIKISGAYDTALESTAGMETDYAAGTSRTVKFMPVYAATAAATTPIYSATAYIVKFDIKTSVSGRTEFDGEIQISGSVTRATSVTTFP